MSITITQIAKLAGVSRGTVDRVIHQRGRVAPEVEKRIRDIMDENDYHPNMLGRALAVSKTPLTIGMIMIEKGNPFFQLIHSGMKEAISQFRDYPILVYFRHINGVGEEEYLNVLDELENNVNALIIAGLQTKRIVEKVNQIAKKIPVMTLNIDLEDSNRIGFIGIDDYKAGTCLAGLTSNLTRSGENVSILSGSKTIHSQSQRINGFLDTMKQYPEILLSNVIYTEDKLEILRDADAIFREEIANVGLERDINQYFAVITDMRSVGVMGDGRTYDYTLALRAVTTTDFMTADWARIPFDVLEKASNRIVNEVKHVNRLVYDITSKPPATIEWE